MFAQLVYVIRKLVCKLSEKNVPPSWFLRPSWSNEVVVTRVAICAADWEFLWKTKWWTVINPRKRRGPCKGMLFIAGALPANSRSYKGFFKYISIAFFSRAWSEKGIEVFLGNLFSELQVGLDVKEQDRRTWRTNNSDQWLTKARVGCSRLPQTILTHLPTCSPNFPSVSYLDERTLTYKPDVSDNGGFYLSF